MGRLKVNVKEFVLDVRAGFTDTELMQKYGISEKQLSHVYEKLFESGKLNAGDMERQPQFEATVVLASTCPGCGSLRFIDAGACPNCGMVSAGTVTQLPPKGSGPSRITVIEEAGAKTKVSAKNGRKKIPTAKVKQAPPTPPPPSPEPESEHHDGFTKDRAMGAQPPESETTDRPVTRTEPLDDGLPSDEEFWAAPPDAEHKESVTELLRSGGDPPPPIDDDDRTVPISFLETQPLEVDDRPKSRPRRKNFPLESATAGPPKQTVPKVQPEQQPVEQPKVTPISRDRKKVFAFAAAIVVLGVIASAAYFFRDGIISLIAGSPEAAPQQALTARAPQTAPRPPLPAPTAAEPTGHAVPEPTQRVPVAGPDRTGTTPPPSSGASTATPPRVASAPRSEPVEALPVEAPQPVPVEPSAIPQPPTPSVPPAQPAPEVTVPVPPLQERNEVASAGPPPERSASRQKAGSELADAVKEEDMKSVRGLLDMGVDVDAPDSQGITPLMHAVKVGNGTLVKLLVEKGADMSLTDAAGATALDYAMQSRNKVVLERMLAKDTSKGAKQLLEACRNGRKDQFSSLLDAGADLNGRGEQGETVLMVAAGMGRLEMVKMLLERGADPTATDKKGVSALGWARSPLAPDVPLRVQREVVRLIKDRADSAGGVVTRH